MIVRNLIILTGMLAVAIYFAHIFFRKWKGLSGGERFYQIGLLVLWLIMIGFPNFPVLLSLFTFPIKGKVIDYTTNRPIANCNIIASWEVQTAFLVGGGKDIYHQYITKTDANGEYNIPRYMKALSIIDIGIISNEYGGVHVVAYTHGYDIGASGIDEHDEPSSFEMKLSQTNPEYVDHTISTLEAVFNSKNYKKREIGRHLSYGILSYDEITQDDKRYILEECKLFDSKLKEYASTHRYKQTLIAMENLGRYFDKLGEFNAAKDVKRRTKELFPEPDKVKSFVSEKDIQLFKQMRREGKL